ncbi:MAG TPA: hypothetical protein VG815_13930, partial [Chloroflexota bacterium]|nr:hypothetical protein [Chloroflexota bacterium]
TWIDKPAIKVLNDVACNGPSFCELVGPNGALVMASGGNQYKQKSPTTATLNAVACPAGNTCYAVGANGTVVAKK